LVKINTSASIAIRPQDLVGKGKYGCRYYNETPKFQLVEVSMGVSIAMVEVNIIAGITSLNE
jgi:hypothetical protein